MYFSRTGAPVHKEWGDGARFSGRSNLGVISYTNGTALCFTPYRALESTYDGVTFTINPYYNAQEEDGAQPSLRGIVFPLHPTCITRLENETVNWGRYCYRKLRLCYYAISPTSTNNSYNFALSHDVSLPFTSDWMTYDTSNRTLYQNLLSLQQAVQGSAYQGFEMVVKNYRGEKTWPTATPYYDADVNEYDMIELATETETFQQYFYAARSTTTTSSAFTNAGTVFVEYEIDFYAPRMTQSPYLEEGIIPPLHRKFPLSAPSKLSPLGKRLKEIKMRQRAASSTKSSAFDKKVQDIESIPDPPRLVRQEVLRTAAPREVGSRSRSVERSRSHEKYCFSGRPCGKPGCLHCGELLSDPLDNLPKEKFTDSGTC
jgi:hypothetical protein